MASSSSKIWTVPNVITMIRVILIPIFVILLLAPWPYLFYNYDYFLGIQPFVAAFAFAVIAATDCIDGAIARKTNCITDFGKFMDPLADKILVCAALFALVEIGSLPSWVALIVVAREFIVSGLRMLAAAKGVVIAASIFGKVKTVLQIIAIIMFILMDCTLFVSFGQGFCSFYFYASWTVMIISIIMSIVSMGDYFAKSKELFN
ncbi:MAG: CDP-diacylglycerol--glycerol-3-phosphate 3-phosphatidyltransferase [Coriobacteriales bacterium]|nr:CDP-diacylglycerol--glycerol-3-phosphate 3-phosphatidyltransferase [Coriobacteriales bacterium]